MWEKVRRGGGCGEVWEKVCGGSVLGVGEVRKGVGGSVGSVGGGEER